MNKVLVVFILVIILLTSITLRFYGLDRSPPSLNWDEAAFGVNAYTLMKTGRDEYGMSFPLFLRSFDEYKPAIPAYLVIPSFAVFGVNEVSLRGVSAFFGVLSVLLIFIIAYRTFNSGLIGLISSFLFAISPFSVFFSRGFFEANIALVFFLLGWVFYLYRDKKYSFFLMGMFFILSIYTYNSYKAFIPLLLLFLLFCRNTHKGVSPGMKAVPAGSGTPMDIGEQEDTTRRKPVLDSFIVDRMDLSKFKLYKKEFIAMSVLLIPLALSVIDGSGLARFSSTSIFVLWPSPIYKALIVEHQLPNIPSLLIHNPLFYFSWEVIGRYLGYFSPMNIFVRESIEPGFLIPGIANLYSFEFLFWLIGLLAVFRNFSKYKFLIGVILLSPIPAVITWNWYQNIRVLPLLVCFTFLSAFGIAVVFNYLKSLFSPQNGTLLGLSINNVQKLSADSTLKSLGQVRYLIERLQLHIVFAVFIFLFCIWNSLLLLDSLIVMIPKFHSGSWQPGFKESIPIVASLQDQYDQIIIDSPHAQPYIFTLFYQAYPPERYLKEVNYEKISKKPRDFYDFGKYKFRKIYWPDDRDKKRTLFMGTVFSLPENDIKSTPNAKIIEEIEDGDGNISVRIVGTD